MMGKDQRHSKEATCSNSRIAEQKRVMTVDDVGFELRYFLTDLAGQGNFYGKIAAVEILNCRYPDYIVGFLFLLLGKCWGHNPDAMPPVKQVFDKG